MGALLEMVPVFAKLLERVLPDKAATEAAKLELMRLVQTGDLAQLNADLEIQKANLQINLADAQSGSNYRGGWRPMLGWICGAALAWDWVIKQVFLTVWTLTDHIAPVLPTLSMEQIMGLISCLLGLSGMRTFERIKGKA
jgi:hypothetical protein